MAKWEIKSQDEDVIKILENAGFDNIIARVLANRGCKTYEDAVSFICAEEISLFDPGLLPDIEIATAEIKAAVSSGKKITVYGDYDVDGVTSVTSLLLFFFSKGISADYYIPDRKDEGYGLSVFSIDKIKENGTEFIITVDTGTTAIKEVEYAKSLGIDIVVTDHHECSGSLPNCPVVNPKRPDSLYPFKELAGVGVVFKLISYIENKSEEELFDKYGIFAAIGTIADIMPLLSENRRIVYGGISSFNNNRRYSGISALLSEAGCNDTVDAQNIAYKLAPRLNACGRMGSASDAVKLLLSSDKNIAKELARILCKANEERRQTEQKIFSSVEHRISSRENHNIIVEGDESWHNGVIGIVSSRLSEKYRKPAILFSFDKDTAKGSARSVDGVNIYNIISASSDYLLKFGGHEMAAGLTVAIENFEDFRNFIYNYADENISESQLIYSVKTECVLPHNRINLDFYELLTKLEPFGASNPKPIFTVKNLVITAIVGVSQNKHSRITLKKDDGSFFSAMYFSMSPLLLACRVGDIVDIACCLGKNTFRGNTEISVMIKAVKFSDETEKNICSEKSVYENECWDYLPSFHNSFHKLTKNDVAAVYKLIRAIAERGSVVFSPIGFLRSLSEKVRGMNYIKFRLCIDVLRELSLIDFSEIYANGVSEDTAFFIKVINVTEKTSLEKSRTFVRYSE